MGLLDGKVAIVTGAGNGIGRAHAIALAAEGAAVVVNDLGVARDGSGGESRPAELVAAEIRAAGGQAVANFDSVATEEGAAGIAKSALDAFGRIDVLVNNAGILRDKTFLKTTREMYDIVVQVHQTGTWLVTQACAPHMTAHGGSIINTTSYSGLKGNFGQANYAAAKAGIWGMTHVLAMELGRFGIRANCIAPMAKTRMTTDIDMVPEDFTPEMIAPMVVFLASDLASDVTDRCFGCHGPELLEYVMVMTPGAKKAGGLWTPSEIAARLGEIGAMPGGAPDAAPPPEPVAAGASGASAFADEVFARIGEAFLADRAGDWKSTLVFSIEGAGDWTVRVAGGACTSQAGAAASSDCVITFASAEVFESVVRGTAKADKLFMAGKIRANNMGELMKFAQFFDLSRAQSETGGASAAPGPAAVSEATVGKPYRRGAEFAEPAHIEAFAMATGYRSTAPDTDVPPTFAVRALHGLATDMLNDPAMQVDLARLVHGEQDMVFVRPLRRWDLLTPRGQIEAVEAKSTGTLIRGRQRLLVDGDVAVDVTAGYFVRGSGGRGEKGERPAPPPLPDGAPVVDATVTVTREQIAAYAEASGDRNPIHLDDDVARAAGLPSVIAHGLLTLGLVASAVVEQACGGRGERLARLRTRFAKPVLPGDTLRIRGWATEAGGIELRVQTADGTDVLANTAAVVRS